MLFKKKTVPEELISIKLPYAGKDERLVRVFVPEHKKGEKLPVIYMTDGQSVFDKESNPLGCWFTREAVRAESAASGGKAIIVGIHSPFDPMVRTEELTPGSIGKVTIPMPPIPPMPEDMPPMPEGMPPMPEGMPPMPEGMPPMPEGMPPMPEGMPSMEMMKKMIEEKLKNFKPSGEAFDDFVVGTVIPAIEKDFPVKKGRENTAIVGSSSGGLEVFYIGMNHPDLFCAIGALSPVFGFYAEEDMQKWLSPKLGKKMPFVYLYCGEGEAHELEIRDGAKPTFEYIKATAPSGKWKEVVTPEAVHNEKAWEPVFKDFLHIFLTQGKKL